MHIESLNDLNHIIAQIKLLNRHHMNKRTYWFEGNTKQYELYKFNESV